MNFMKNVWNVARRDFRSYFTSPIAYIVIAGFMVIMGWMFYFSLTMFIQNQSYGMGHGASLTDGIIVPLYGNMNVIFLFMVPFITMRLFAEEKKQHTLELLMTSPITLSEIILGKFLSCMLLISVMMGFTLVYPIILLLTGNPELGPIVTNLIGVLLLASCYVSLGVLCSSVTENQIVAGALAFAAGLFFWLVSWASQSAGPVWSDLLTYLSLISHNTNFRQGVVNTPDIIYYVSFSFFSLFLTHRVLDSYRWR
jgi:ABC-2 type transport system permease protein